MRVRGGWRDCDLNRSTLVPAALDVSHGCRPDLPPSMLLVFCFKFTMLPLALPPITLLPASRILAKPSQEKESVYPGEACALKLPRPVPLDRPHWS